MEKTIYEMTPQELESLIAQNQERNRDEYVRRNRGYITASKLKMFETSPEAFFIKYILEMPLPCDDEDEKASLKIGTAADDYISYGEMVFYSKYFVEPEKFLKDDIIALLEAENMDTSGTVEVLKARLIGERKRLTNAEGKKVFGMIREWKRQPLFDFDGQYEKQSVLLAKYKGLSLRATLDRISVEKSLLRDTKTTASIEKFNFQALDLGYDFSMSFYNVLAKLIHNIDFMVILDACQTTYPYPSDSMVVPKETVVNTAKNRIIPKLDKLADLMKRWEEIKNPKIWLEGSNLREYMYKLDTYGEMETTLQKEFSYLQ